MKRNQQIETHPDFGTLADDAKALLAATAEVAEDKVVAARERLATALEHGREAWDGMQERAIAGAKAADRAIHKHPYPAIGVAFGFGALLGYLLTRRGQ
jgi:ElaB/YqjD/DUF883 family membrane-anchored ribosome-binding protein